MWVNYLRVSRIWNLSTTIDSALPALAPFALGGAAADDTVDEIEPDLAQLFGKVIRVDCGEGGECGRSDDSVGFHAEHPLRDTDAVGAAGPYPVHKHLGESLRRYRVCFPDVPEKGFEDVAPDVERYLAQGVLVGSCETFAPAIGAEGGERDAAHGGTAAVGGVVAPAVAACPLEKLPAARLVGSRMTLKAGRGLEMEDERNHEKMVCHIVKVLVDAAKLSYLGFTSFLSHKKSRGGGRPRPPAERADRAMFPFVPMASSHMSEADKCSARAAGHRSFCSRRPQHCKELYVCDESTP